MDRQSRESHASGEPPAASEPPAETPQPQYWLASAELGVPTLGEPRDAAAGGAPAAGSVPGTGSVPAAGSVPGVGAPAAAPALDPAAAAVAGTGPPPRAGRVPGADGPGRGGARPSRAASAARRLSALLVMLLVAGVLGYGLAFLSAGLMGRANSAGRLAGATAPASPRPTAAASGIAASAGLPASPPSSPGPTPTTTATEAPSSLASPAPTSPQIHVVAPGETLTSIAARYGVSVHALAAANGITDLNAIYVGQKLVIPAP